MGLCYAAGGPCLDDRDHSRNRRRSVRDQKIQCMDSPQGITVKNATKTLVGVACVALITAWHIMFLPASAQVSVTAKVPGVCGNGVVEPGEQCDAGGSNGSCPAACSGSCTTNSCGGGGGGGGGGGSAAPVAVTQAVFSGKAYPGSTVTILK